MIKARTGLLTKKKKKKKKKGKQLMLMEMEPLPAELAYQLGEQQRRVHARRQEPGHIRELDLVLV
jgi:hypothetical protein